MNPCLPASAQNINLDAFDALYRRHAEARGFAPSCQSEHYYWSALRFSGFSLPLQAAMGQLGFDRFVAKAAKA